MHTDVPETYPAHAYILPRYRITLEKCAQRFSLFSPLPYERKGRHAA